jgi:methylase of polypeptide subunit release factors
VSCFSSADESAHYGFSVCMLLQQYREHLGWEDAPVVELGTGDASAIADVVAGLPGLRIRSYDISADSVASAQANIAPAGSPTATPSSSATSSTRPTPRAGSR